MTTERTEEDYAEIMEALSQFEGKRVQLSYSFSDGTEITGVQDISKPAAMFVQSCVGVRQPFQTAADAKRLIFDVPGPSTLHLCPAMTVEVWDNGFHFSGHGIIHEGVLIEP